MLNYLDVIYVDSLDNLISTINTSNTSFTFNCQVCRFKCSKKGDYTRHITTAKHLSNIGSLKKTSSLVCNNCDKSFNDRSGLWRHKKKCIVSNDVRKTVNPSTETEVQILSNTIFELVKQNNEFKQLLIEQNQKMMDMAGNIGNNHHNTINSNNKFNLNVFLNEKCKNAMSLTDFVNSMNLTIDDFIQTGERGFIDGISNIIIDRIHNMDLHDRPLHCTDLKRETVYIKDSDKWEKDEDKVRLRKAVKGVAYKNERMRPIWYEETPEVDILGSESCEKFFKYSESALGGCGKEETKAFEDKVIRNVLKESVIDKNIIDN